MVFSGFCAIIFYRWSDISRYECRYQSLPASELVSGLWCSYLSKEKIFFGIDVALPTWSTGFCMQTLELTSFKQNMFNDPLRCKFTKSKFRYYPNDDASFNVELALLLKDRTQFNQKLSSSFFIPTRITQRFEDHVQFNHPYRFEYANLLSSRYRPSPSLESSSSVRNLGVILDPSIDMEDHIKKICKTYHFHLTTISEIRSYLDRESTEAIIHAFVTTNFKLDYCNAILYGLPKVL